MQLVPRLPERCVGQYRPERLIARGGSGAVWLATQRVLGRSVAVKVLEGTCLEEPGFRERFEMEARATAAISSPYVVRVLDSGADERCAWIVYEHLAGPTLRQVLLRAGQLGWRRATRVVIDVAEALSASHAVGILHRDLKPENVVEALPGRFKLIDFGIADWSRLCDRGGSNRTGVLLGTPSYMAPEQILDERCGPALDLYALGVLYFELLVGCTPFARGSVTATLNAHLNEAPPDVCAETAGVPPAVGRIVARLLAKAPEDRPASAEAVLQELRSIVESTDASGVHRVSRSFRPAMRGPKRTAWAFLLVVAGALLGGALGLIDWSRIV